MAKDFLPNSDDDLEKWDDAFQTKLTELGATYGVSAPTIESAAEARTNFKTSLAEVRAAQTTLHSTVEGKDDYRAILEETVRPIVRQLQAHPAMTDAIREEFGITVPKARAPVPAPEEVPLLRLDFGTAGRLRVHFGTDPGNEQENKLPTGSVAVIIQAHLGGVPTGDAVWEWLANDTNSPYVHVVNSPTPKTFAYRVAYLNRKQEQGPWSAPAVGTISAS